MRSRRMGVASARLRKRLGAMNDGACSTWPRCSALTNRERARRPGELAVDLLDGDEHLVAQRQAGAAHVLLGLADARAQVSQQGVEQGDLLRLRGIVGGLCRGRRQDDALRRGAVLDGEVVAGGDGVAALEARGEVEVAIAEPSVVGVGDRVGLARRGEGGDAGAVLAVRLDGALGLGEADGPVALVVPKGEFHG